MSRTRESIEDSWGPVQSVAEEGRYEVLEDADGHHWIGRNVHGEVEFTLVDEFDSDRDHFEQALRSAGVMEGAESGAERFKDTEKGEDLPTIRGYQMAEEHDCNGDKRLFTDEEGDWWIAHTDEGFCMTGEWSVEQYIADVKQAFLEEDPAPSPEDVAETWIEAHDKHHDPAYAPANDGTEIRFNPGDWENQFRVVSDDLLTPNDKDIHWNAHTIERVDAADVPFSEVPVDE